MMTQPWQRLWPYDMQIPQTIVEIDELRVYTLTILLMMISVASVHTCLGIVSA